MSVSVTVRPGLSAVSPTRQSSKNSLPTSELAEDETGIAPAPARVERHDGLQRPGKRRAHMADAVALRGHVFQVQGWNHEVVLQHQEGKNRLVGAGRSLRMAVHRLGR